MGFFNWAAPAFGRLGGRWSEARIDQIAEWLRPYVPRGGALVDVGGGTGQLAVGLQEALQAEVTVVDPTLEMLAYIPDNKPVHAVVGSAEAIPFPDNSFDALVVTDAFHHFRDQEAATNEFTRVVKPGGVVLVVEMDPRGFGIRMVVVGERILGEPGSFLEPEELRTFMNARGIDGDCAEMRGSSYRYLGVVKR